MITDRERETALALLARSRTAVLNAVDGVTEQQARWKPAPDRWSILEYIEHLAVSDDALVALVRRSLETPAHIETEDERRAREQKIRETPVPRGVNQAPENLKPVARFDSLADAVTAVSKFSKNSIWVYITDLLPRQMVEFGHVLPEPGDEERWAAALPGPDRAHMQSLVPARR